MWIGCRLLASLFLLHLLEFNFRRRESGSVDSAAEYPSRQGSRGYSCWMRWGGGVEGKKRERLMVGKKEHVAYSLLPV